MIGTTRADLDGDGVAEVIGTSYEKNKPRADLDGDGVAEVIGTSYEKNKLFLYQFNK